MLYVRAVIALALPLLADVVVPIALLDDAGASVDLVTPAGLVGVVSVALGCLLLIDSVFVRFAREGRGTLAPVDPPVIMVRGGAYRYIRNPMYVANIGIVLGLAAVFRSARLLGWAIGIAAAFQLFVVAYEEPTLRRLFGADYETYARHTGRWIPRKHHE